MYDSTGPPAPKGCEPGRRFLEPIEQTFEWLSVAVTFASHNVTVGHWNKTVLDAYLRTCAVSNSVRANVWRVSSGRAPTDNVKRAKKSNPGTEVAEMDDGELLNDFDLIDSSPDGIPGIWRSQLLLSTYIDCGMHLIFHGILATAVERIEMILSDYKLNKTFERLVNSYFQDIISYRLEWCKIKSLPKNNGLRKMSWHWQDFFRGCTLSCSTIRR